MGDKNLDYSLVYRDIIHLFPIIIHLKARVDEDGEIIRYLSALGFLDSKNDGDLTTIYENSEDKKKFYPLPSSLQNLLAKENKLLKRWKEKSK